MTIKKISTSHINDKHVKGIVSELKAVQYLLEQGFLVFQNVAPNGIIDIVAISPDNETFRIDVKTKSRRKTKSKRRQIGHEIYRSPSTLQKQMNVVLVVVGSDSWKVHPTRSGLSKWLKQK